MQKLETGLRAFFFSIMVVITVIWTTLCSKYPRQIKKMLWAILFIVVSVILAAQGVYAKDRYDHFLTLYDQLLQAHVRSVHPPKGGVDYNGLDYDGWAGDVRHNEAKEILQEVNYENFDSKNKKMAFWINAYNFLTIDLIVRKKERDTIKNLGTIFTSPWKKYHWSLAGRDYTLDYIENNILRLMGDARIHFAINCASISCPDMRKESYKADILNQQLKEQVGAMLSNKGKGLRREGDIIYISKIFHWFSEDFKKGDIKGWLKNYIVLTKKDRLKFMDYDWSLNKAL